MATIGQSLFEPESGWKRIDNEDLRIIYNGNFTTVTSTSHYNGSIKSIENNIKNNSIEFYLRSNRLRLISYVSSDTSYSNNVNINIDGVDYTSTLSLGITRYQTLVADINIHNLRTHKIIITDKSNSPRGLNIDAIDVDEDGELIDSATYYSTIDSMKGMFEGCTSLTRDGRIPLHINNVQELYKNCTGMTHIISNWKNPYDNPDIISTDCYAGCNNIQFVDNIPVEDGLDEIPIEWGGRGFDKTVTGIYRVFIPSDNYTFVFESTNYLMDDKVVKWGDGTTTIGVLSHTYAMAGEYIIKGKIQMLYQGINPCLSMRGCCTEVIQYPTEGNTWGAFYGMGKVNKVNIIGSKLNGYGGVKNIALCFGSCSSLTEIIGLETWDVSNITNFDRLFSGTKITNSSFNISNWNLSKATNLNGMFYGCTNLTNPPIINIPNSVTNINQMYRNCTSLTNVDNMVFGTGITSCTDWITGCTKLVSANNVTIKSNYVAQNIFKNNITITSSNDVLLSNVTDISNMYSGCTKLVNCGFKDLTNSSLITTNAFPSTLTTITFNGTYNRTAIQNILKSCPWQINVTYGSEIPTTLTTKDINMNKSSETQLTNLLEGSSKTLEVYGNTIQNLVTNPNNAEETCTGAYISRTCMLKPSTKYTVNYTSNLDVEIDLGGTKINALATETKKLITTPSTLAHGEVRFAKTNAKLKNINVVEGDYMAEDNLNYVEGIQSVGEYDSVSGKYKVEVRSKNIDGSAYNTKTFLLDEPLRKIGDVADRLYWDSNKGYYCVERKIYKYNFIGSEVYEDWGNNNWAIIMNNNIKYETRNIICDKFLSNRTSQLNRYSFKLPSYITTITQANNYIIGALVYYELATPIAQDLPTYNQNVGLLRIWQDKTVIDTSNIIKPSKVKFVVKDIT